jgi:RNA polymerase sigma factor (sigma-70 family)
MATPGLAGFLTRVRTTLAADDRSDAELVRAFAGTRSVPAFDELVRRFAPMVWGVCRRTVGHHQSAEDAFQAVFLVLTRKAGAIRPPAAVGGWLHVVAVHTSLRARAMTDHKRRRHTALDTDHEAPSESRADPDALQVLDEEIARLPDKLRAAVVLCELGGMSRKEAAARLGVAEGTLSSRLATARKTLAVRLRGRGVTLGVGGIAAVVATGTASAVPPLTSTASETATALAEGAIRTMFLSKLKLTAAGVLAVTVLVAAGVIAVSPVQATDRHARRNAPVPKAGKEGVILVGVQEDDASRIDLLTPKGEKVATIPLGDTSMGHPTLSRDGRRVAVWSQDLVKPMQPIRAGTDVRAGTLRVYDLDTPDEPIARFEHNLSGRILFAPDGQSVYALEHSDYSQQNKPSPEFTIHRFDLKAKKKEKLNLPADHQLADITPDGKALLTTVFTRPDGKLHATPYRVPLDTLKPEPLSKSSIRAERFSPDGKRFVGFKYLDPNDGWKQGLTVVDVKDGKDSPVKLEDDTFRIINAAWSADGKKLVVHRIVKLGEEKATGPQPIPVGGGKVPDTILVQLSEVAVRNLDGSEPKRVLETKRETHIFGIDWR